MADLLSRVTSHYRERAKRVRVITVPEWADPETGAPAELYVWPASLEELNRIARKGGTRGNDLEILVETLIVRARKADRSPHFDPAHRATIMREADPDVLARVVGEINDDLAGTVAGEEARPK